MTTACARITTTALLALAAAVAPVAWQKAADNARPFGKQLPTGSRVAVVAYHDSELLTLCPVPSDTIVESTFHDSTMRSVKARFVRTPTGRLHVSVYDPTLLHSRDAWLGSAMLPQAPEWNPPPGKTPPKSRGITHGAVAPKPPVALPVASGTVLDRLAPDLAVQERMEAELRKKGTYVVVRSPGEAEYVLVVESGYTALAVASGDNPATSSPAGAPRERGTSPKGTFAETEREFYARSLEAWHDPFAGWTPPSVGAATARATGADGSSGARSYMSYAGGDARPNWRQWSLALAVPAEIYQRYPGNGAALTAARVWEGFAFEETARGGSLAMRAASPETLADDFSAPWRANMAGLPLCSASSHELVLPNAVEGNRRTIASEPADVVQPSTTPFRTSTVLVTVPLTVRDAADQAIVDVQPSELHVFEDGVEQKIDTFLPAPAEENVALLVDTSASMRVGEYKRNLTTGPSDYWRPEGDVVSALRTFIGRLPSKDRLLLASFSNRVRVHAEWTSEHAHVRDSVTQLVTGGATRLYDAVALLVTDRLAMTAQGRRVIVLITDGVDTRSQLADSLTALTVVDGANTQVYVVRYETVGAAPDVPTTTIKPPRSWLVLPDGWFRNAAAYAQADEFLARLATVTGGRMYFASKSGNLDDLFEEIAKELSQQYVLCYYSSNARLDGRYREIRVAIDRPGHAVRARKGYRAPAAQPNSVR